MIGFVVSVLTVVCVVLSLISFLSGAIAPGFGFLVLPFIIGAVGRVIDGAFFSG